ncbi:MAG: hypothetical protein AAFZ65_07125 [Planctomycetota bacterium]
MTAPLRALLRPRTLTATLLGLASLTASLDDDRGKPADEPVAQAPVRPGASGLDEPADRARREALGQALDWLADEARSDPDGSWPVDDAQVQTKSAITALASLALMSGGSLPDRGEHGVRVARGVDYLLSRAVLDAQAEDRGLLGTLAASDSIMHSHGFATLALAEAYAVSPASRRGARIAKALPLAVDLIERSQGSEGGWMYQPRRVAEHEGSVTICLVQGLRAARNAGIEVDGNVIARAEDYVRRSQADDGLFRYELGSSQRTVALTAAAISTLNATGNYDDPAIRSGVDAIWRVLGQRERGEAEPSRWPYYERFYLVQTFWQLSEASHFERWYEDELERVLATQASDGSWRDRRYGDAYATSMNALFLAVPDAQLPILQR